MNRRSLNGFTLIELLIFIVVVGIGISGVLSVINTVIKSSVDPMIRKQSLAVANALMEEILLKPWSDPLGGTNGVSTCSLAIGSNRSLWTNVCDYNGFTSSGISDPSGSPYSSLSSYNVSPAVVVSSVSVSGSAMKKVVVSITDPVGNVIVLTGYRGNF